MARTAGATASATPKLTEAQRGKMVELHDRHGLSYRAIVTRYGIGEKMAMRLVRQWKERKDG